jgi:drug/metabolite transporter (DMT)-like permease
MGSVNYMHSDLAENHGGVRGSYPFCIGITIMWIIYHLFGDPGIKYHNNWLAVKGVLIRGINHGLLIVCTLQCFEYANLAQVNPGVIASVFTSGVFFTALAFYFVYGEKLSKTDFIGVSLIVVGVTIIGIYKPHENTEKLEQKYLLLSIVFAIMCCFCFAINALVMRHYVQVVGFTPM